MWTALLPLAQVTGAGPASGVDLAERQAVPLLVFSPRDAALSGASPSRLLDLAERALGPDAPLRLVSAEQLGVDLSSLARCDARERVACWVRVLAASGRPPPLVLILGLAPELEPGRAALSLLALEPGEGEPETARVTSGSRSGVELARAESVTAALEGLFDGPLAARLAAASRRARLILEVGQPGLVVELDGVEAARTTPPELQLDGLVPGPRRVAIRAVGTATATWAAIARLEADATTRLRVPTLRLSETEPAPHPARTALLWSGLAMSAAGVAVTTAAIVAASGTRPPGVCLDCPSEPGRFARVGALPGAPLGLGLLLAGGVWMAGPAWLEDEGVPGWSLVGGLALGALSVGLGAALE